MSRRKGKSGRERVDGKIPVNANALQLKVTSYTGAMQLLGRACNKNPEQRLNCTEKFVCFGGNRINKTSNMNWSCCNLPGTVASLGRSVVGQAGVAAPLGAH